MSTKHINIVGYVLIIDVTDTYLHIIQKYLIYCSSIGYPLNGIYVWSSQFISRTPTVSKPRLIIGILQYAELEVTGLTSGCPRFFRNKNNTFIRPNFVKKIIPFYMHGNFKRI